MLSFVKFSVARKAIHRRTDSSGLEESTRRGGCEEVSAGRESFCLSPCSPRLQVPVSFRLQCVMIKVGPPAVPLRLVTSGSRPGPGR
eukprot:763068-Hanusia_phi.AAC.6